MCFTLGNWFSIIDWAKFWKEKILLKYIYSSNLCGRLLLITDHNCAIKNSFHNDTMIEKLANYLKKKVLFKNSLKCKMLQLLFKYLNSFFFTIFY